ncbi:MAG: L-glutamate gamma-semialdehyde dehydrogenase [Polyangiales bacterium]
MVDATVSVPPPVNEPVLGYAPGSPERESLQRALRERAANPVEVASVIDGHAIHTSTTHAITAPHDHALTLGHWHEADASVMDDAIRSSLAARHQWSQTPFRARAAVFLRAAELLATRYRAPMNAATMLGQSKTAHQAEIDAACELIDFWRFNARFAEEILADQPVSAPGTWNQVDHRPLEGFVLAVTPFNFTSIAANLPTAPALMGNAVVWKPSTLSPLSSQVIVDLLHEAGLPPGVINVVYGDPAAMVDRALSHRDFAGLHFTGSTAVFRRLWATAGARVGEGVYRTYPRLVGETGGKDFIFAHASADLDALAVAIARGGYEFQGQKCSAPSRVYVPASLWPGLRDRVVAITDQFGVGDVGDFTNFMGAVIDERAFTRITAAVDGALHDTGCEVLRHGSDRSRGWFIKPTLIRVDDPKHALMREELFGPVVTVFVYPDAELDAALALCDESTDYALTGAIFARDRRVIEKLATALRDAAGNFYVNDKPTGAVVGQQPFGGARASGTNDKAGSALNLVRWVSPRSVKETFSPPHAWRYPFMG